VRRALLVAAAAGALGVPGVAHAQAGALPAVYGGGATPAAAVPAAQRLQGSSQSIAVGLRRAQEPGGAWVVKLRVAIVVRCGKTANGNLRGTDVKVTAPMNADGTAFSIAAKRLTVPELGKVRLWADGTLTPARADGTARVVADGFTCGGQVRTWSARPADPGAPPPAAAPAPVDGVLYGVTSQDFDSYPRGLVAQVGGGGTSLHAFSSYEERCHWTIKGRKSAEPDRVQTLLAEQPIAGGRSDLSKTASETRAQRRKGIDAYSQQLVRSAFSGPAWSGTLRYALRFAQGRTAVRCASPTIRFVAVP